VDELITRCMPDYFARHAALGVTDETPLFVLGMDPPCERVGPDGLAMAATRRLADDYRATLRRIGPVAARVTDKLPHNFMWIGLIHLVFPRARIIHRRRHPVDTCLSIYSTQFFRRMSFANDRDDLVWVYRQYDRLMAHWREVLPPDRFIAVEYEELVADREGATRRLIAFCGLDWNESCLRPESNKRVVTTARVWQVCQPVYRGPVERWRNYEPWRGALRELMAQA
jgi:hypothetical protein